MFADFIHKIARRRWLLFGIFVLILPAYLLWKGLSSGGTVLPDNFLESKRQSAIIADQIVGMSNIAVSQLDKMRSLEKEGNYYMALDVTNQELKRVSDMREKANGLLSKLTEMTNALPNIKEGTARETALQAINYEIGLINNLISYNNDLDDMLKLTTAKILYNENIDNKFTALIDKLNNDAATINDLNGKFNNTIGSIINGTATR